MITKKKPTPNEIVPCKIPKKKAPIFNKIEERHAHWREEGGEKGGRERTIRLTKPYNFDVS